ncbi:MULTISPECIES: XRE family transcriptional regulator [unclassified Mesorhizobium]|uniref:XRE family transcriptional regulator n=1 Tax=unclassified Mesorhizobium TaxID=325217 RepID=UPI00112B5292|nr:MULTISPECIES: XRE family transcriptional regulator [unclassified Mesorhizobium]MBZ9894419.1 XRE family transcriptional regulator [Mesorhizobium sp. BR1-1-6]TPN38520.1 XRE family transcriptional regulator [Mesorhizobium sp. B1-1-6]
MAAPKRSNHRETTSHARAATLSFTAKLPAQADFKKVLLERYQEAVARSRKVGHRVSFRVEVDPAADAQTITPVEEQPFATSDMFPIEEAGKPDAELEAALASARERGRKRVAEIVSGEDMLSADAFAKLLGTSRVTVNAKRQSGQVLGIDGAKRGFRFPVWQLDKDGRPFGALPILHSTLGNNSWAVYRFLVSRHGALDGRTGLQALQRGDDVSVLTAAEGIASGDFN